jgi:hypothetical protein
VLLLRQLSQAHFVLRLSSFDSMDPRKPARLARLNNLHLAINLNGNDLVIITFELAYKASATKMVE